MQACMYCSHLCREALQAMYQSASALRAVLIPRACLCQNCLVNTASSQLFGASKLLSCISCLSSKVCLSSCWMLVVRPAVSTSSWLPRCMQPSRPASNKHTQILLMAAQGSLCCHAQCLFGLPC